MNNSDLYSKLLEDYKRALCSCDIPLYDYCLIYHISYNSFQAWMRKQNMTLKEFNPAPRDHDNLDSVSCTLGVTDSSQHIYPLSFHASPVEEKFVCEQIPSCIKGVNITFPNGMEVSIEDVTAKELDTLLLSCNTAYCDVRTYRIHESALTYSLACSCRLQGINTFEYFTDILNRMACISPNASDDVYRELLPNYWKKKA